MMPPCRVPYIVHVTATGPNGETSTVTLQINVANPAPVAVDDQATTPARHTRDARAAGQRQRSRWRRAHHHRVTPARQRHRRRSIPTVRFTTSPNAGFTGTETIDLHRLRRAGWHHHGDHHHHGRRAAGRCAGRHRHDPAQTGTDAQPITPIDAGSLFSDPNGGPLTSRPPACLRASPSIPPPASSPARCEPDASVDGPYAVTVTAVDPDGNQVSTTFVLGVTNPAPVAAERRHQTPVDTPVTIAALANDSDPDGDALGVTYATDPANGTVVINPDGTHHLHAGRRLHRHRHLLLHRLRRRRRHRHGDRHRQRRHAAPTRPSSQVPRAPATGTDGAPITPIDVGSARHRSQRRPARPSRRRVCRRDSTIDPATGIITGTLEPGASSEGPFNIVVTAVDPDGNQVHVPVVLTATNPAPSQLTTKPTTAAEQPVVIGVLGNDSDPDGDTITVTAATDPANGSVVINANGTITYTPDAGFTGTDTFTYTITDADGATKTATVTVNVGTPGPLAQTPAIAPVTGTDGATITPVVVTAAFGDPDQTGPLTLCVDTTALPPGITFNPADRHVLGHARERRQPGLDPRRTHRHLHRPRHRDRRQRRHQPQPTSPSPSPTSRRLLWMILLRRRKTLPSPAMCSPMP